MNQMTQNQSSKTCRKPLIKYIEYSSVYSASRWYQYTKSVCKYVGDQNIYLERYEKFPKITRPKYLLGDETVYSVRPKCLLGDETVYSVRPIEK